MKKVCIYDKVREFFPIEREKKLVEKLVDEWKIDREDIHIYVEDIPKSQTFPLFLELGVIAGDWPGFSEAVLGTFHEKGWNIHYISGSVIDMDGTQLGIIIAVIKLENKIILDKFILDEKEIVKDIRSISIGSLAKRLLISIESKRLEIYSRVVDVIEKKAPNKLLNDLIGPEGEAFKFFASRSKAYIEERTPECLAEQIIINCEIQKDVLESKGEIQLYIENLKTSKENLTGMTIGVFEKDMCLKEILDSISYVLPDVRVVYNKEFTNQDGVLVARIEISDSEKNAYPPSYHERIKRVFKRIHSRVRSETGRLIETTGGFEHYLRAIIPFLISEFKSSGIPQAFLSVIQSSEFFLEFKIIVVCNRERSISRIPNGFDNTEGLTLLGTHPPKVYGDVVVNVFDVRGESDQFDCRSDIYDAAKEIIRGAIGDFRDFDEGMRQGDIQKLNSVIENLPALPEKIVKPIYYSLEDFWRMSASIDDIVKVIQLACGIFKKWKKGEIIADCVDLMNGTAIVIASPKDKTLVGKVMKTLSGCEITLSRIERPASNVLLAFVSVDRNPIPEDKITKFLSQIKS
ncbi:hypothetical protein KAW18_15690 [candidate division WOR-3 bacterium]|nr:hypothetical protein [candidate division WOR-3 bacterium]MCK4528810.1 hypothetical protein [candidate division WOR-3 bacterium]